MARISVTKCQGTGNDFVLLERRSPDGEFELPALATALCDRHFGVGADGLLVLEPADAAGYDIAMRIFNADGSSAEMCGNGVRCVARYLYERRADHPLRLSVQTDSGKIATEVVEQPPAFAVRVAMGVPDEIRIYGRQNVAGLSAVAADVTIGNPHSVAFVEADLLDVDLPTIAKAIVDQRVYADGVNVEVARIFPSGLIAMRVSERGVGETLACGTGACAVALAAIEMGRARSPVRVQMQGGEVIVDWAGAGEPAYLTGTAELVFDTTIDIADDVLKQTAAAQ